MKKAYQIPTTEFVKMYEPLLEGEDWSEYNRPGSDDGGDAVGVDEPDETGTNYNIWSK